MFSGYSPGSGQPDSQPQKSAFDLPADQYLEHEDDNMTKCVARVNKLAGVV